VGTWKLDVAKAKSEPRRVAKSQTRTVVAEREGAKYSFEGVRADGAPSSYSFTVNYDGKDYPVTGTGMPGGADTIAIKRVGTLNAEATLKKGGKEIGKSEAEVSRDGKTAIRRLKGSLKTTQPLADLQGQPLFSENRVLRAWLAERGDHASRYVFVS
jgi:hypothetical protein